MEDVLIVSSALLWLVVLCNVLLTLGLVRRINATSNTQIMTGLKPGDVAPNFAAQMLNGEEVTRSAFAGRKVIFLFISTQCGPCREFLPRIEPLWPKAAKAGVELILVSSDEIEKTRTFITELNLSVPTLVAPLSSNSFAQDYKSTMTPSYCFINEQGKVQSAGYTDMAGGEWKALVDAWADDVAPISSKKGR